VSLASIDVKETFRVDTIKHWFSLRDTLSCTIQQAFQQIKTNKGQKLTGKMTNIDNIESHYDNQTDLRYSPLSNLGRNIKTVIQTLGRAEAIKLLKSEKVPDVQNTGSEELKVDLTLIADI
jgi:hypothetical protein